MTIVLTESKTILVVADISLVTEIPAKLKNAIEIWKRKLSLKILSNKLRIKKCNFTIKVKRLKRISVNDRELCFKCYTIVWYDEFKQEHIKVGEQESGNAKKRKC